MGQRLGQHFLSDTAWQARIARAIGVRLGHEAGTESQPGSTPSLWLEIGAGHGEMTRHLAVTGARIIAIEIDAKLQPRLRSLAAQFPQIELISRDILDLDLKQLTGGARFRVYGNLPYYITSPILRRLLEHADLLDDIYLVTQVEVAQRIAANPGSRQFGYLSVLSQFYARPEILFEIPRGAFDPPPKVTSALIHLQLPGSRAGFGAIDEVRFLDFAKLCFAHKRKTLVNNLRPVAAPKRVAKIVDGLRLGSSVRAEQLSVAQFVALYRGLDLQ